jgi:hypothetical protein
VCLGKTRRTGRGLATSRPVVDPLERRNECQEHDDHYRDPEEYEGSPVISPLVTHERILPLKVKAASRPPPNSEIHFYLL